MAYELGTLGQRDRFRVNIADAPELQAWCGEFNCTPDQLKLAVGRSGVMATDVLAYLERQAGADRRARSRWSAWLRLPIRHWSR
jgi:hypothetical protein